MAPQLQKRITTALRAPSLQMIMIVLASSSVLAVNGFQMTPFGQTGDKTHLSSASKIVGGTDKADVPSLVEEPHGHEDDASAFSVGILGDLHIDPRKLEDYNSGRKQWLEVLEEEQKRTDNMAIVSLGDLGESKYCDHNPYNKEELFSGTSLCHEIASDYLGSFKVPYEVVGGNHDLEGIDEFKTDQENLDVFLQTHNKDSAQFCREIAEKTLLVGLGSTVFRDAPYTSHEVIIDEEQIQWFESLLQNHPAEDGWKVFCFTHAPPNGSGLRVLQENHVVNGCCWLNHSDEDQCRKFIELVQEHRCIKAWFSGHFHLGQDYQDSITFPTEGEDRGSCVFCQTSVMRAGTSRDGRRQSRLLRGNQNGFEVCTVDHAKGGEVRVDATITYEDDQNEVGVYTHEDEAFDHDDYFKVYTPEVGDEGHIRGVAEKDYSILAKETVDEESRAWWRLSSGRVLGMSNGLLLEYDKKTLSPLGLVVSKDELMGKKVAVVESTVETGPANEAPERDQAVLYYDEAGSVTVIQPNEDGSYWRKIVRNKIARMAERRREKAAAMFARTLQDMSLEEAEDQVLSSWGPYTTTSGTAKTTQIVPAGLISDCKPSPCEPVISRATVVEKLLEGYGDTEQVQVRPLLDLSP